jgi:hypothetical protein
VDAAVSRACRVHEIDCAGVVRVCRIDGEFDRAGQLLVWPTWPNDHPAATTERVAIVTLATSAPALVENNTVVPAIASTARVSDPRNFAVATHRGWQ